MKTRFLILLAATLLSPAWADSASTIVMTQGTVQAQESPVEGAPTNLKADAEAPPVAADNNGSTNLKTLLLPWTVAVSGDTLSGGAAVRTGAASSATLALDGVEIKLDAKSQLTLPSAKDPDHLRLQSGQVWIHAHRPLRLTTPQGDVRITGTELVLSAGPTESSVAVIEGHVQVGSNGVDRGHAANFSGTHFQAVEMDVNTRRAWVAQGTTPEGVVLTPFFADDKAREAARQSGDPIQQARVYLDEGRQAEAAHLLEGLGRSPAVTVTQARLEALQAHYDAVARLLADLPSWTLDANTTAAAWSDMGLAQWGLAHQDDSHKALGRALVASPGNPYVLALEAWLVDYQTGNYALAAEHLRDALRTVPGNVAWHRQLGDVYATMARYASALDEYRTALRLKGAPDPETSLRQGRTLIRLGQPGEARRVLQGYRQFSLSPEAEAHYALTLGYAEYQLGDYPSAQKEADHAAQLSQSLDPSLQFLAFDLQGIVLTRRNLVTSAIGRYRDALGLVPDDPFVLNDLGMAQRQNGDRLSALDTLLKAREKAPWSPVIRTNLGILYFLLGQDRTAQSELEQAYAMAPANGVVSEVLAAVLFDQGRSFAGERMHLQGRLLDPRQVAVQPSLFVTDDVLTQNSGPQYFGGWSGLVGPVALQINGQLNLDQADLTPQTNGLSLNTLAFSGEMGFLLDPKDHVWASYTTLVSNENTVNSVPNIQSFSNTPELDVGYYREIDPKTSFWFHYQDFPQTTVTQASNLGPAFDVATGSVVVQDLNTQLQEPSGSWEGRLDHQLSPTNSLSVGFARKDTQTNFTVVRESPAQNEFSLTDDRFSRFWLADRIGRETGVSVLVGANFDGQYRTGFSTIFSRAGLPFFTQPDAFSGSSTNPFISIQGPVTHGTRLALTAVRQSDVSELADLAAINSFSYLSPVFGSSSTLFPLLDNEYFALINNSLVTGEGQPYWDYRFSASKQLGRRTFGSIELYHDDVMPPDFLDPNSTDSVTFQSLAQERSSLNGAFLQFETAFTADFLATIEYHYRDYHFTSDPNAGNRWAFLPESEFDARLLHRLARRWFLEVDPTYQSTIFEDRANQVNFPPHGDATLLVHWFPAPWTRFSFGYENVFGGGFDQFSGLFLEFSGAR